MGGNCDTIIHTEEELCNMVEEGKRKVSITLTLSQDIIKIGKEKAAEDNRTLSNYVETLILKDNK